MLCAEEKTKLDETRDMEERKRRRHKDRRKEREETY